MLLSFLFFLNKVCDFNEINPYDDKNKEFSNSFHFFYLTSFVPFFITHLKKLDDRDSTSVTQHAHNSIKEIRRLQPPELNGHLCLY